MLVEQFSPARLWRGLRSPFSRISRHLLKPIYRRLSRLLLRDLMLEPEFQAIANARLGMEGAACNQLALGRRLAWLEDRIEALQRRSPQE
jgi:hypothetical protein